MGDAWICQFWVPKVKISPPVLPRRILRRARRYGHGSPVAKMEISPVRNDSARKIKGLKRSPSGRNRIVDPVDRDERLQLPDTAVRIAPGQHVKDQVEMLAPQVPVRIA